jgi:act minimal PKS acyl carrier protein
MKGNRMSRIELTDLMALLKESAGDMALPKESTELLHTPFADLGYDSLALLETAALIERRYGARLTDEIIAEADTPQALLAVVNQALSAVG